MNPSSDLNTLLRDNIGLIRRIAQRLSRDSFNHVVDVDDLVQVGCQALLEAAPRYDPSRGAAFTTYAEIRIRGSMRDEIRDRDWMPRSVQRKRSQINRARARLAKSATPGCRGPKVPDELVAVALGISPRVLALTEAQIAQNIDHREDVDGAALGIGSVAMPGPMEQLERDRTCNAANRALRCLKQQHRKVLHLYYDKGMTMREIGERLNVTESRIAQIRGAAERTIIAAVQGDDA